MNIKFIKLKNAFILYGEHRFRTHKALNVCPVCRRQRSTADCGLGKSKCFPRRHKQHKCGINL